MPHFEKHDIKSLNQKELEDFFVSLGEKPFRARQVYHWMHISHAGSFDEMGNIPQSLKEKLKERCELTVLRQKLAQRSKVDETAKYLFGLPDGNMIESVRMKYKHGNSVCISSQAGCRMGCRFCASTLDGLARNLTPAEMLEQVYRVQEDIGERVSHVVVMGSGEPLDNYDNLLKFLELLSDGNGLHISQRNITVSTCGIVPNMRRLAGEKLQITLAISLHAASQKKREELMPVARKYGLEELLEACGYYFGQTGRRITFEYSLVGKVNDRPQDARQLAGLLKGQNCHVNLIPVNPIKERAYVQPDGQAVKEFRQALEKQGITVTVRREMGRDIDGACGQLRRRQMG